MVSVSRGRDLLAEPMTFSLSRPHWRFGGTTEEWERARVRHTKQKKYALEIVKSTTDEITIRTKVSFGAAAMPPAVKADITYTFRGNGNCNVSVSARVNEGAPQLPRFGLQLVMPKDFSHVKYIGYGPSETYADRFRSQRISEYKTTVKDNYEHYIYPTECGAHFGTKIAAVTDDAGHGFVFADTSKRGFVFNVKPYTDEQIISAAHDDELPEPEKTVVNLDYKMRADSLTFTDQEPWRAFAEKEFAFSYDIIPI